LASQTYFSHYDIAKLEVIYPKTVTARELKTTKERVGNQFVA
jgi:hypothetical protein